MGRTPQRSLTLLTWPDYISPSTLAGFEDEFGIAVRLEIVGSAVDLVDRMQIGARGVDLLCPPDYAVRQLAAEGRLRRLDPSRLTRRGNLDPAFLGVRPHDPGDMFSVPKDWGTTGYLVRTDRIPSPGDSWEDFWRLARANPRRTTVLDSPHEVIGAALKLRGHSYNSEDAHSLTRAHEDLVALAQVLLAFTTDYRPMLASGEAWMSLGWNGDAAALRQEGVPIAYILPVEGSQIWEDDWAVAAESTRVDEAHAFLDYLLRPEVAAQEAVYTGYATPNRNALKLLPREIREDPSRYPGPDVRSRLEAGRPHSPEGHTRRKALWEAIRSIHKT